jgi:hypothetical protein
MAGSVRLSSISHLRHAAARAWIERWSPAEQVLLIGSSLDSANELVRQLAREKGAIFGWHRLTLPQLAAVLARPLLVERNLVPVSRASTEALVTRVVQELASASALGRYAKIASGPGFAKAVTGVLMELRLAGISAETIQHLAPELANILERYETHLARAGFADWPSMLAVASESVQSGDRHQTLGLPTN